MFLIFQNSSRNENAGEIHWTYRRKLEVESTPMSFLLHVMSMNQIRPGRIYVNRVKRSSSLSRARTPGNLPN